MHKIFIKKWLILPFLLLALTACQESFDERCRREAREYTERFCPQQMDNHVTLDSTVYDATSRTYRYYYSIARNEQTAGMEERVKAQEADFRSKLLLMLINSVQLKPYKDEGINFEFVYAFSADRTPMLRIRFTRADYDKTAQAAS